MHASARICHDFVTIIWMCVHTSVHKCTHTARLPRPFLFAHKEGIAFVLNLEMVNKMTWFHGTIIENRASKLTIATEDDRELELINI